MLIVLFAATVADLALAGVRRDFRQVRAGAITDTPVSSDVDADPIKALQHKLVKLAERYANMTHVPYIWGGGQIGSKAECDACRKCVAAAPVRLDRRLGRCSACRKCGVDCSHFVYRLYRAVGLDYRYASTRELNRLDRKSLMQHYQMVDVGRSLADAQPGDLLLYPKHVTMLLRVRGDERADFVHASRFRQGDRLKLGGLRLDMNQSVHQFRGRLLRILRHASLHENPDAIAVVPLRQDPFATPMTRAMHDWLGRS